MTLKKTPTNQNSELAQENIDTESNSCYQGLKKAMNILGDKWSGMILLAINDGNIRFTDLDKTVSGICPRTLTQKLTSLESQGLLKKDSYMPNRSNYLLTDRGQSLIPIIKSIQNWAGQNL